MKVSRISFRLVKVILLALGISMLLAAVTEASARNRLTLINFSGDNALVKLAGPSRNLVEIPNGSSKTVNIAGGEYMIYVRYGTPGRYRYTKGEHFQIQETSFSYTMASLTLHGVANGNYRTEGSSENEFNRQ